MIGSSDAQTMVVLVAERAVVVLPRAADAAIADRVRAVLRDGGGTDELIGALVSGGLQQLPSLGAVVCEPQGLRLLVRGAVVLTVVTHNGSPITISAPQALTTWREEVLDAATWVGVAVGADLLVEWYPPDGVRDGQPSLGRVVDDRSAERAEPSSVEADSDLLLDSPADLATGVSIAGEVELSLGGIEQSLSSPVVDEVESLSDAEGLAVNDDQHSAVEAESEPSPLTLAGPFEEPLVPIEEAPLSSDTATGVAGRSDEPDFDFSHLLEETRFRGVEAAAIRPNEDEDSSPALPIAPASERSDALASTAPPSSPPPASTGPPSSSGLIDGVPGGALSASPPASDGSSQPADLGDHDGLTIAASDLRKLLGDSQSRAGSGALPAGPTVRAVHCSTGHPNPAHAERCRICGGPITDRTVSPISRPSLGRLRFSSGPVVEIDRPQLIGRRPKVDSAGSMEELPGLVTLQDPEHSLSRVHLEIRLEDWEVFVLDRSTNGTVVEIPGQSPLRLRAGEPCLIVSGTRVRLSDAHDFQLEVGE